MARKAVFTAAELAAGPEAFRQPDVERRLADVEGTLSLLLILTRAVSQSQDLCLTQAQRESGWSMLSDLASHALADVWATQAALPADAQFLKAPRQEEA